MTPTNHPEPGSRMPAKQYDDPVHMVRRRSDSDVEVEVPDEPPQLTPRAAAALLTLLIKTAEGRDRTTSRSEAA
jgi:hypothetical protein